MDELVVSHRKLTGSGLFGEIGFPNGLILSAHIEMQNGKPKFLELYTLLLTDWDGNYSGFIIKN